MVTVMAAATATTMTALVAATATTMTALMPVMATAALTAEASGLRVVGMTALSNRR